MQTFSCRTKIISGSGAVAALSEQNIGRLLMVTDPFFFKNGTAQHIAALKELGPCPAHRRSFIGKFV